MSVMVWTGVGTSPEIISHSQSHPNYLRVEFDEDMTNNAVLIATSSYSIPGLVTMLVTRVDANTVDIVFDLSIPEALTVMTVVGPQDLALNPMNGTYEFNGITHFKITDAKPYGKRTFLLNFSMDPYTADNSSKSAMLNTNWTISDPVSSFAVTKVEKISDTQPDHLLIHTTRELVSDVLYTIILSPNVLDSLSLAACEDRTQTSYGFVKKTKENLDIIANSYEKPLPAKRSGRYSSNIPRFAGYGYVIRDNQDTLMRVIVRKLFSKFYWHIDKSQLLGLEVKDNVNFVLELMRKRILSIINSHQQVIKSSCSLSYSRLTKILRIEINVKTQYGESMVPIGIDGDGAVTYG